MATLVVTVQARVLASTLLQSAERNPSDRRRGPLVGAAPAYFLRQHVPRGGRRSR